MKPLYANASPYARKVRVVMSAAIDHFGMFGAVVRPLSGLRMIGLTVLLLGLAVPQLSDTRPPT